MPNAKGQGRPSPKFNGRDKHMGASRSQSGLPQRGNPNSGKSASTPGNDPTWQKRLEKVADTAFGTNNRAARRHKKKGRK